MRSAHSWRDRTFVGKKAWGLVFYFLDERPWKSLNSGRCGGGSHSMFAKAFLSALADNKSVMETQRLFTVLRETVTINADQTPEYADVRKAGHDGGDFIFVRKR